MAPPARDRRIRLLGWALFFVLAAWFLAVGWPIAVALAQDAPVPAPVTADPFAAALLALLQGGGLPAVLGLVAWWARGAVASGGVPVIVRLSDDDRRLLERAVRVLDRGRRDLAGALSEVAEDRSDEPAPERR